MLPRSLVAKGQGCCGRKFDLVEQELGKIKTQQYSNDISQNR